MQASYPDGSFMAKEFDSEEAAKKAAQQVRDLGEAVSVDTGKILSVGNRFRVDGLLYEVRDVRKRGRIFIKLLGA
jgi:hypothetical protein